MGMRKAEQGARTEGLEGEGLMQGSKEMYGWEQLKMSLCGRW